MKHARIFLLVIGFAAVASVTSADTITSTPTGGLWSDSTTWVGDVVPDSGDVVVIAGPVEIADSAACQSLSVLALGSVHSAPAAPNITLQVTGPVTNAGTIADGAYNFVLEVGGDLHNDGAWANSQLTIIGSDDRELSHGPAASFATDIIFDSVASGDVIATTPLFVTGQVDLTGSRLILQPDCPFSLDSGRFSGGLLAGGNEMRFVSWSYLDRCTIDDVVLVGEVEAATAVTFTTRVTVKGILQNGTGGGGANIEGDLINHGVIQNDQYSFLVRVHGDIENHGAITNPQLELVGVGAVHHLSMGPGAVISASIFLPEFQSATLVADTPVRFAGGLGLGVGTLILEPGSSLQFDSFGGLGSGTVEANGNEISIAGSGALSSVTIDKGVLADQVVMYGECLFTGGLTVTGTLVGWPWAAADLTVEGLLRNEGDIRDGDHPVSITALGNIENLGAFTCARIVLAGATDQAVGAGPGIAVPEFILESGLEAASYQWFRDGAPLAGATGQNLVLVTVGPADYGSYHCEGNDQVSRNIYIDESLVITDVPGATVLVALEQNHPNPFNPTTEIAFSLDSAGPVSLVVYDLAGREIARLIDGETRAGRHRVTWQPRGLPSGTYVYRLRAGGADVVRKCSLLK